RTAGAASGASPRSGRGSGPRTAGEAEDRRSRGGLRPPATKTHVPHAVLRERSSPAKRRRERSEDRRRSRGLQEPRAKLAREAAGGAVRGPQAKPRTAGAASEARPRSGGGSGPRTSGEAEDCRSRERSSPAKRRGERSEDRRRSRGPQEPRGAKAPRNKNPRRYPRLHTAPSVWILPPMADEVKAEEKAGESAEP